VNKANTKIFVCLFLVALKKIAKSDYELRHVCRPSDRLSVRPSAWNNWASTGRIFIRMCISVSFANLPRKFKFGQSLTRITGTLQEDVRTFTTISRLIRLRIRNISDNCTEKKSYSTRR
jgi:hypothetical protein